MNGQTLTHLDLFSGVGGFALAAGWAGFRTIAFCEIEPFCRAGLKRAWPSVPIENDVRQFSGARWRGCTLITAGVPCQPVSRAGLQRGVRDDRWLWPDALRVVSEAGPAWAIFENPLGLEDVGLDGIISDLEGIGYEVGPPLEIPACAVNAPHRRQRIWLVAHSASYRREGRPSIAESTPARWAYPPSPGRGFWGSDAWVLSERGEKRRIKSGVHGMAYGVSRGLLRALGNAIVPQVAYEIIRAIAEIEKGANDAEK